MLRLRRPAALLVGVALLLGCGSSKPVVRQRTFALSTATLDRVAVMPFHPDPGLASSAAQSELSPDEAALRVAGFVADALSARGMRVIPPTELMEAVAAEAPADPRRDPRAAAFMAARDFDATAVMVGQVMRYRDRAGEALGATRAASVAFRVGLYDAPSARKLWAGRFDETQPSLSSNVFQARRFPGGGTRWLTAEELTRWGAGEMVEGLPR